MGLAPAGAKLCAWSAHADTSSPGHPLKGPCSAPPPASQVARRCSLQCGHCDRVTHATISLLACYYVLPGRNPSGWQHRSILRTGSPVIPSHSAGHGAGTSSLMLHLCRCHQTHNAELPTEGCRPSTGPQTPLFLTCATESLPAQRATPRSNRLFLSSSQHISAQEHHGLLSSWPWTRPPNLCCSFQPLPKPEQWVSL